MKKLMLGLMMAFAVTAEAEIVKEYTLTDSLTATLDDQGVLTINGNGAMPNWELGSDQAWYNERSQIKSVVAEGEVSIGEIAFAGCENLKEVSLPNATTIGDWAFQSCGLTSVYLLNATTIGERAFGGCGLLDSVSLPNATTIGRSAFFYCSSLASVSLPNATTIGEYAFQGCPSLTSVSLPNATTIGQSAFAGCSSLTSVSLPNATTIGEMAFAFCSALKTICVNRAMKVTLENDSDFYGVGQDCKIVSPIVVIEPHPAEHSTANVYTNGVEVTDSPILVLLNATVDVVFTVVEEGYCFEDDHSTVQTNTVTATDDPTKVDGPMVVKIPSLREDETQQARYVVQEAEVETNVQLTVSSEVKVLPSVTLKSGDTVLDQKEYEYACEFYGIPKQTEPSVPDVPAKPTADDFKVVSKDTQVVQEGEIAVKKESIAAPSAGTVTVEDNKVQLGVTVLKTSDLTAEKKEWGEVTLSADDVKVVDGKIVISVPVDSASGFMILQSKDAKIETAE